MDTIRIAGAQCHDTAEELSCRPIATDHRHVTGIRLLADWELLLAAGGDVEPDWPLPDPVAPPTGP